MDVSVNKLYLYDNILRLLLVRDDLCFCTDNGPMNKRMLKVHKGLDNKLVFRVFDPNRQPVDVCMYSIYARIMSRETEDDRELILEKRCYTNSAKGMVFLDLNEGDIANISEGIYNLVIVGQEQFVLNTPDEVVVTPFYNDFSQNVSFDLEVTGQAQKDPVKSAIILKDDWIQTQTYDPLIGIVSQYYSSAFKGARVRNHLNGVHSFSIYSSKCNAFSGKLEVLGTLDLTPNPDPNSGWFNIHVMQNSDHLKFINFYGTDGFTFTTNCMWIKFRVTPNKDCSGLPEKILFRS